jgi:hypothetical protein
MNRQVFMAAALLGAAATGRAAEGDRYEKEFARRAEYILKCRASEDPVEIMRWAEKISLGDPHKYALGPIMARLHFDPKDEKALGAYRMLMEVDKKKKDRGLYHFAVYQRTRLYFQFKERLPADILASHRHDVRHFFEVMTRGGTENHAFMHRASGCLWSEEVPPPYSTESERANRKWLTDWLRRQAARLYHVGMGEYDSSTYVCFSAAALANVYDFSKHEDTRNAARAALDWMAAALAVKYFHGCHLGPESRGFAASAVATNTDWMSWLWWGGSARPIGGDDPKRVAKHAVTNLALSTYRPHPIVRNIATKKVALPFAVRAAKPTYYGWSHNHNQESLYFNRHYAMGTLYCPDKGVRTVGTILPQTTMFKAALLDDGEVRTFGAANGYHRHYPIEGRSPYDQYHQVRDAAVYICYVNHEENERVRHRSILGVPKGIDEPARKGGWYFWQVNKAYLAARPLNGEARWDDLGRSDKQKQQDRHRWLVSPGKLGGWVVQLAQQPDYATLGEFQRGVLSRCKLDLSGFRWGRTVSFVGLRGDTLKVHHTGGPGGLPDAWTNGKRIAFHKWPVYESPYVNEEAESGILRLTDGRSTLTIDFSEDEPAWAEGKAGEDGAAGRQAPAASSRAAKRSSLE